MYLPTESQRNAQIVPVPSRHRNRSSATHIDIIAAARRLVQIRPSVDIKRILTRRKLAGAHVERRRVGPHHVRVDPGDGVAGEGKRAVRVLVGAEGGGEGPLGLVRGVLDVEVERRSPGPGVVDELAIGDVELPGCEVAVQQGGPGPRGGQRLQVAVEVRRLDAADPVPARQEGRGRSRAGAGACRARG